MSHSARLAACLLAIGSACSSPKPADSPEALDGSEPLDGRAPESLPAAAAEPTPIIVSTSTAPTPGPSTSTASDASVVETLFVSEALVDCQGESAQKCLQVRGSESEEWRNFYAPIEGFEHEASTRLRAEGRGDEGRERSRGRPLAPIPAARGRVEAQGGQEVKGAGADQWAPKQTPLPAGSRTISSRAP